MDDSNTENVEDTIEALIESIAQRFMELNQQTKALEVRHCYFVAAAPGRWSDPGYGGRCHHRRRWYIWKASPKFSLGLPPTQ
jgi:hypothetical protein